ncbi:unnamed protein product [Albugo candida]|uniref:Uncharacterized protein n=1 Tax=Albugo candida TaxID=65357 RepID=A0A024GUU5_9STRA|nr:unnamed protein product [Albugo candida]|eukprot:CCI50482.1 unnamed protein product [Albugo candida]
MPFFGLLVCWSIFARGNHTDTFWVLELYRFLTFLMSARYMPRYYLYEYVAFSSANLRDAKKLEISSSYWHSHIPISQRYSLRMLKRLESISHCFCSVRVFRPNQPFRCSCLFKSLTDTIA